MSNLFSMRRVVGSLCFICILAAGSVEACINTGSLEPCHCIEKMMMNVLRAAEPAVAPSLSGATPAATNRGVRVGNTYYHSDTGNPFGDLTITAGDTVQWIFDAGNHTVTSTLSQDDPEYFDSGYISDSGTTYDHTFNTPGSYTYYCQVHSFLQSGGRAQGPQVGTITVVAAPEPAGLGLMAIAGVMALRRNRKRAAVSI
jgi:plastocyanin